MLATAIFVAEEAVVCRSVLEFSTALFGCISTYAYLRKAIVM